MVGLTAKWSYYWVLWLRIFAGWAAQKRPVQNLLLWARVRVLRGV